MAHHHPSAKLDSKIRLGLLLNTAFMMFEFGVGVASGSLALISDAGHNLTDSLGLLIAFLAERFGRREADIRHSFGHERMTIIAALMNGAILILLALYIFYEAAQRIMKPAPVSGGLVTGVAMVGIVINGSIAFLFSKDRDLHMRSAFLGMLFDTLASVGAMIAGIVVFITHNTIADPLASIFIGIMLLVSTWEVVNDSLHILLEGVPAGIDSREVREDMKKVDGVQEVDDLHIWSLSSHDTALSCHIVIGECTLPESTGIVRNVKNRLRKRYNIGHATIEVELTPCQAGQ